MFNLEPFIGLPYEHMGRGPKAYDCYGLLIALYEQRGITLPDYVYGEDSESMVAMMLGAKALWEEDVDKAGNVFYMRIAGHEHHVGVSLGFGKFIHTWQGSGSVVIERTDRWRSKILGCFKYVG